MRRRAEVQGRLHAHYHEVNERHFAGLLPTLPILIVPMTRKRRGLRSIACTYCDDMGAPRRITMDEAFALTKSWGAVRDALTHEMGHVWQAAMGLDLDHGPSFHRIAKRLGISERAVD